MIMLMVVHNPHSTLVGKECRVIVMKLTTFNCRAVRVGVVILYIATVFLGGFSKVHSSGTEFVIHWRQPEAVHVICH